MEFVKRFFGTPEPERHPRDIAEACDQAKALASQTDARQVVLIRPDLSLMALACPAADSMPEDAIRKMETIVPSGAKRKIAVVTDTGFAQAGSRAEAGSPAWIAAGKDLPFFGILNGLGCIGHTVWIFDATADLGVACGDADILIIDSAVRDRIPDAALEKAREMVGERNIFVHDRLTFQLHPAASKAHENLNWDALFDMARARTSHGGQHRIVLVRPDQSLMTLPCIPLKAMTKDQFAQAHRIIPEGAPRNVAAIAETEFVPDASDGQPAGAAAQLRAAGRAIPFLGLLLNLASAGNPTWIFDGASERILAGCRSADLLFIDSALADRIPMKMLNEAAGSMRSANIAVYDRNSRKIALLRSLSGSQEKLAFRD